MKKLSIILTTICFISAPQASLAFSTGDIFKQPKITPPVVKVPVVKVPVVKIPEVKIEPKKTLDKTLNETGKAIGAVGTGAATLIDSGLKEITKPITDSGASEQIAQTIKTSTTFVEDQFQSVDQSLKENEKRLLEGKVLDAMYHLATDPAQATSTNSAKAISSSPLLNQVAAAAASAYGGPAGAAAYASWLTYETTGDINAALKAGVMAGTSAYLQSGDVMPEMPPELKQQIAKFSVNASAIAASGGNEQDIMNAFKKQAEQAVKDQVIAAGTEWVKTEIIPKIPSTEIENSPKSWENMSIVQKAEKVKKSYDQYKKDIKDSIKEHTKIDINTIALNNNVK
jgi:hypothetical protein